MPHLRNLYCIVVMPRKSRLKTISTGNLPQECPRKAGWRMMILMLSVAITEEQMDGSRSGVVAFISTRLSCCR